jgi:hypothetical protein
VPIARVEVSNNWAGAEHVRKSWVALDRMLYGAACFVESGVVWSARSAPGRSRNQRVLELLRGTLLALELLQGASLALNLLLGA